MKYWYMFYGFWTILEYRWRYHRVWIFISLIWCRLFTYMNHIYIYTYTSIFQRVLNDSKGWCFSAPRTSSMKAPFGRMECVPPTMASRSGATGWKLVTENTTDFPKRLLAFWKGNGWKWDPCFFQENLVWWKIVPCGKIMVEKCFQKLAACFAPWKLRVGRRSGFHLGQTAYFLGWNVSFMKCMGSHNCFFFFFLGCNPWFIFHGFGVSS